MKRGEPCTHMTSYSVYSGQEIISHGKNRSTSYLQYLYFPKGITHNHSPNKYTQPTLNMRSQPFLTNRDGTCHVWKKYYQPILFCEIKL